MAEHTPGPWEIEGFVGIISKTGRRICHTNTWNHIDTSENKANAIAIAALPELLEAAEWYLEVRSCWEWASNQHDNGIAQQFYFDKCCELSDETICAFKALQAAIDAARGNT